MEDNVRGLHVARVIPGSPSDIVGLRTGDLVTSVNGENVNDLQAYYTPLSWFIVHGIV